jgi:F420-non-reducing hydrogenase iron-sulfur subunit
MNNYKPNIVIFSCNFCSPPGAERAMASKLKDNFRPIIIKINCTGRIDPTFVIDAFVKGADGVMIAGCAPGDCHFVTGNYKAGRNVLLLKRMLSQLGIEPERLRAEWLATSETPRFLSSLNELVNEVTVLGPLTLN